MRVPSLYMLLFSLNFFVTFKLATPQASWQAEYNHTLITAVPFDHMCNGYTYVNLMVTLILIPVLSSNKHSIRTTSFQVLSMICKVPFTILYTAHTWDLGVAGTALRKGWKDKNYSLALMYICITSCTEWRTMKRLQQWLYTILVQLHIIQNWTTCAPKNNCWR